MIYELSKEFPIKRLCKLMNINRSGFYKWKFRINNPSRKAITRASNILLFRQYHEKYPSHGYRWLNAMIRNETGLILSDVTAHRCCKFEGIVSKAKHYKYKKPGEKDKSYPNLFLQGLRIDGPLQCVASDMTAFSVDGIYFELTMYMDLWNNEILTYSLSRKRGDRMTYISGLNDLINIKKEYPDLEMVLHTDQGSVYSSKSFNELLPSYNIIHSMSRAGTPTDNGAMEAINGWMKTEMLMDFHIHSVETIEKDIKEFMVFFNEKRPAYSLNYLTPKQYKELHSQNNCVKSNQQCLHNVN